MALQKLSGDCNRNDCPGVYTSGDGSVIVQGPLLTATEGLTFSEGEVAVRIPAHLIEEAARALGR
ncbi:hypothetical protein ACFV4I_21710 [Nocardiopsis alba]|uniref:Uncharacterized protein n=1 Tax=Nocardiopsis exhalans TaxID=163604 RepID=A0ABY5D4U1_9ACTN|nr:hypothetical protein [Nocardiopsis exhalans]USY18756.1 hypothetical protein NE857_26260 [Nocardiopsis exhalans]